MVEKTQYQTADVNQFKVNTKCQETLSGNFKNILANLFKICLILFILDVNIPSVTADRIEQSNIASGDAIWYDLTVSTPGLIGVNSMTDGDYDRLFLYLYDPSGNQVAADEDYQPFNQASITYNANTTGVFKIKSYLGLASGPRNLSTSSPYLLTQYPHNKEISHDIPSGDAVWYDLTVSTPGLVGVNSRTDGDYDRLFLYLYDPSGNQVAADENYQPFNQASITYVANTTGVFKVKSYLGLASATRNLSTSSPYLLTPAPYKKETSHDIPSGDAVWYDLTVSTPGLVGVNSRTDGDYDRLFLYLYDPSGNQVAADENYQPFNQASITYVANTTGVFKVKSYLGLASATRNISTSYSVLRTVNSVQIPVSTTKVVSVSTNSTPNSVNPEKPVEKNQLPPDTMIPIAAAAGTTIAVGAVAAVAGGSIMNRFSSLWAKFDELFIELFREFFKKLFKKLFKELFQKLLSDKLISKIVEIFNSYLSEPLKLLIGAGILFFAFSTAYSGVANKIEYDINPLIFVVSLAFFSMFSEISQDLGLKFSLKSAGISSIFRLSPIGSLITILSGFSGFVIAAVGSSKSLNEDNNPQINVLAIASGSLLNMLFGLVLLVLSLLLQIKWLAAVGAVPSLASATCGLFPSYPFEGRKIFKDNRFVWGLLFFISLMLYLLARMVLTRG